MHFRSSRLGQQLRGLLTPQQVDKLGEWLAQHEAVLDDWIDSTLLHASAKTDAPAASTTSVVASPPTRRLETPSASQGAHKRARVQQQQD